MRENNVHIPMRRCQFVHTIPDFDLKETVNYSDRLHSFSGLQSSAMQQGLPPCSQGCDRTVKISHYNIYILHFTLKNFTKHCWYNRWIQKLCFFYEVILCICILFPTFTSSKKNANYRAFRQTVWGLRHNVRDHQHSKDEQAQ